MIIKIKILIDILNSISLVTWILSTVISSLSNYQYFRIEIGNNYYACVFMNLYTVYYQSLPKGFEGNTFVWLLSSRCINWLRLCIAIVVVRPFSCMYALCCVSLSPSLVLYRFYLFNILKSQVTNQKWRNGGKEKVTRGNKKNILRHKNIGN